MANWNELFLDKKYELTIPQLEVYKFIKKLEGIFLDEKLLIWDLCCGMGRNTSLIGEMGHAPFGSDISENGVLFTKKLLRDKHIEGRVEIADMVENIFKGVKFHGVFSWNALHHNTLDNIKKSVKVVHESLVDGGLLMVTIMSTKSEGYNKGREIEKNTFISDSGEEAGVPHHYFDEKEIRELFVDFEIVILAEQVINYIDTEDMFYESNPFPYTKWAVIVRK